MNLRSFESVARKSLFFFWLSSGRESIMAIERVSKDVRSSETYWLQDRNCNLFLDSIASVISSNVTFKGASELKSASLKGKES
eukprot:snap_masked-scaffold_8-processed-gene-11.5-mRNA-1 protein AED:1.00 eAED:1.00 QI:0/0/0/0/1/1/2/0/82